MYRNYIKRMIDFILSLIAMLILWPIFLIISILIKLDSKGPILFKQKRIGKNKKHFYIFKFRTMKIDTPKDMPTHMLKNPEVFITRVGKFLRKTSLDEFPQFINVLKGEMSIVGPRPYLHREIPDMKESYNSIIKVKPGITGMWQVSGRSDTEFEERLKLDEYYVRNWSLWLDIVIILKTIKAVFAKRGAY